jgi:hypothetical protein
MVQARSAWHAKNKAENKAESDRILHGNSYVQMDYRYNFANDSDHAVVDSQNP